MLNNVQYISLIKFHIFLVSTCPPLTGPDNGDIDCSLGGDGEANPGDFICDDGLK